MSITKIIVNCSNDTMGDNVTDSDADGYRAWLAAQLAAEFPEAVITVTARQGLGGASVDADAGEQGGAEDRVNRFLGHCWDHCGWEWVST